jgi:hypothetical protein
MVCVHEVVDVLGIKRLTGVQDVQSVRAMAAGGFM